jgi:putative transposase
MPWQRNSDPILSRQRILVAGPSALKPEHIAALHEILAEDAQASLEEIAVESDRRCGVRVCTATIRRALRAQGVVRLKATRRVSPTADKGPKRYGYTAAQRREDVPFYSTKLTDAKWDLVADLCERALGQRSRLAQYSRRELVNACSYVLRTGCAWRLLPTTFLPWQAVYKAFVRWVAAGVFEQMQDRLREQWRSRMGLTDAPTAAFIDARTNRSSRRAAKAALMQTRRSRGESAASSLIRWVWSLP